MRKKSHILLARCLADHVQAGDLQHHRKAFCFGSILPDLKPSFLTTKHAFNVNFDSVQEQIKALTVDCNIDERNARVYWRQLGEVTHHVADYFTFPHNRHYEGNLKDHCKYEKNLLIQLREYLNTFDASKKEDLQVHFDSLEDLFEFIKEKHEEYMSRKRNVEDDCRYIVTVNYQITQGIIQLLEDRKHSLVYAM